MSDLDTALRLLGDMVDPDPCWFDHHGGCQAHGYLSLDNGERCPNAEATELLARLNVGPRTAQLRGLATSLILWSARDRDDTESIQGFAVGAVAAPLSGAEVDLVARMIRQADIDVTIPTNLEDE